MQEVDSRQAKELKQRADRSRRQEHPILSRVRQAALARWFDHIQACMNYWGVVSAWWKQRPTAALTTMAQMMKTRMIRFPPVDFP